MSLATSEQQNRMAGAATAPLLLDVRNLEVVYNRVVRAVQGVSIKVSDGAIVGIVGINGAGKTTIMSAIAGFMSRDIVEIAGGQVIFAGSDCTGLSPDMISRRGMSMVPERDKVFVRMTTWENLVASATHAKGGVTIDTVFELFPRLAERRHVVAGYLSGGERQMLAISMAILSTPKLLLIDEFSLGLAPSMVEFLTTAVLELRRRLKISVLFVEQSAANATHLADSLYIMESGQILLEGPTGDVAKDPRFRNFYLGMADQKTQRSYRAVQQFTKRARWFG
jgi:branched-chain amino acid transport system ATP-binding protein